MAEGLTGRSFAAVLFDLDGTLIDSTPAIVRAWTTWATEFEVPAERFGNSHGLPSADLVRRLLPEDRHEQGIARINELELADVADIVVLPGAARAMAELAGARTAIATSAARDLAKARIAAADLVPPTVIITVDDVRRGKPAPDPFLEAARRLDVDPADCLVVEDATNGLQAARSAGCATLGLLTTTPADQLDADLIVPDLAAVEFAHDGDRVAVAPR